MLLKHSCTVQKDQLRGYGWPGLLLQISFCQPCKTTLVHCRAYGATGWIGAVPNCCWCQSQSLLWIVYISVTYWEHSTIVYALMVGRAHLRLDHPPPPPPLYVRHPWYYKECKKLSQKNQQWILHSRVSYETAAIRLL